MPEARLREIARGCVLSAERAVSVLGTGQSAFEAAGGICGPFWAMSDAASVENPVAARYKNPRVSGKTANDHVRMPGKNA